MNTPTPQSTFNEETEEITLVERREEYKDTYTYIFHPAHPVAFEAGQYAHVRIPWIPEGIRRVHELSFASPPTDSDIWFGIDSRSGSEYQKALLSLKPGDAIQLFKIRGHMTWPAPVADVVMIAGGVGVTPFRSMLLDAREQNSSIRTTLVQVASGEFLYANELKDFAGEHLTIRRPQLLETLEKITSEHPDAHYYIAGSADFVNAVTSELTGKGITRIESDEFKGLLGE